MAELTVNGQRRRFDAEPETPLLWALREQLGLTGTKYGCGVAQCGSCTVHIDGVAMRSCALPISALNVNQKITTVEALDTPAMKALQRAWIELDVPQCGFCQSGMLMAAAKLLADTPKPNDKQIEDAMTNICRCGTYNRVRDGIHLAASRLGRA